MKWKRRKPQKNHLRRRKRDDYLPTIATSNKYRSVRDLLAFSMIRDCLKRLGSPSCGNPRVSKRNGRQLHSAAFVQLMERFVPRLSFADSRKNAGKRTSLSPPVLSCRCASCSRSAASSSPVRETGRSKQ